MAYTKLFNSIVTSSIWSEPDHTRIVWITLLALADKNGEVQASMPGLARVACVPIEACEEAIASFLSPDRYSRTPDDEGRRIEVIDGGWHLLNHAKYRRMASKADAQEKNNERQRRFQAKKRRNAKITDDNGFVTDDNGDITQDRDIAEAEAEAEAKKEKSISEKKSNTGKKKPTLNDFTVTDNLRQWASKNNVTVDLDAETEQWRDHHIGRGTKIVDAAASWRTWMRNSREYSRGKSTTPAAKPIGMHGDIIMHDYTNYVPPVMEVSPADD